MAKLVNTRPNNITEYPNSFKRQGAFPLEADSVFATYELAKQYAETSPIAYVTQLLGVADGQRVDYYVIANEAGALFRFGSSEMSLDKLDRRVAEIEKFFALEEGESLKDTLDQLIELQKWIEEHLVDFDEFKEDTRENFETETKERMLEDDRLQEAINDEVARATNKESQIAQNLSDATVQINATIDSRFLLESTERTNAINELESSLNDRLNTEAESRATNDGLLQVKIDDEIVKREEEVEGLKQALFEETGTARAAESELNERISEEERTRASEDLAIRVELNNEKEARQQEYALEAATRLAEDTRIETALAKETTDRIADAEAEEKARIEADEAVREDMALTVTAELPKEEEASKLVIKYILTQGTKSLNPIEIPKITPEMLTAEFLEELEGLIERIDDIYDPDGGEPDEMGRPTSSGLLVDTIANLILEKSEREKVDVILQSQLETLIAGDGGKSARTIANEELAAQLLSGKADADFKTLQQLAAWLEEHPEDVAAINAAIQQLENDLAQEASTRADETTKLSQDLSSEISTREAQVNELGSSLEEEINRATEKEEQLSKDITNMGETITNKILPNIVNADYEENRETERAYIINRPFYDKSINKQIQWSFASPDFVEYDEDSGYICHARRVDEHIYSKQELLGGEVKTSEGILAISMENFEEETEDGLWLKFNNHYHIWVAYTNNFCPDMFETAFPKPGVYFSYKESVGGEESLTLNALTINYVEIKKLDNKYLDLETNETIKRIEDVLFPTSGVRKNDFLRWGDSGPFWETVPNAEDGSF